MRFGPNGDVRKSKPNQNTRGLPQKSLSTSLLLGGGCLGRSRKASGRPVVAAKKGCSWDLDLNKAWVNYDISNRGNPCRKGQSPWLSSFSELLRNCPENSFHLSWVLFACLTSCLPYILIACHFLLALSIWAPFFMGSRVQVSKLGAPGPAIAQHKHSTHTHTHAQEKVTSMGTNIPFHQQIWSTPQRLPALAPSKAQQEANKVGLQCSDAAVQQERCLRRLIG